MIIIKAVIVTKLFGGTAIIRYTVTIIKTKEIVINGFFIIKNSCN